MTVIARVRNLDHHGATLSTLENLPNLGYKFARNNTGDAAWSVPLGHPSLVLDGFAPKRTDYRIDVSSDNGITWEPAHAGMCGPVALDSGSDSVEVVGVDWLAWLDQPYKFTGYAIDPSAWVVADIIKYWVSQTQETIITDLIDSVWNGNVTQSVHITTAFDGVGWTQTLPMFWFSIGDTNSILDFVKQIGELSDPYGFEFWMDYNKVMNFKSPRRVTYANAQEIITFKPSSDNLVKVAWGNEGPKAVTTIGMPPAFPAFIGYSTYAPSVEVYRNWWQLRSFNEMVKSQFLTDQATGSIAQHDRNPQKNITITVQPETLDEGNPLWFFQNQVGEIVEVDSEDWFQKYHHINGKYWIDTQALSNDNAGNWLCTMTLEQIYGSEPIDE